MGIVVKGEAMSESEPKPLSDKELDVLRKDDPMIWRLFCVGRVLATIDALNDEIVALQAEADEYPEVDCRVTQTMINIAEAVTGSKEASWHNLDDLTRDKIAEYDRVVAKNATDYMALNERVAELEGFVERLEFTVSNLLKRRDFYKSESARLTERVAELEELVDTYPKTADGVCLRFGDATWGPDFAGEIVEWRWGVLPWTDTAHTLALFREYYSTRESAVNALRESEEVDDGS